MSDTVPEKRLNRAKGSMKKVMDTSISSALAPKSVFRTGIMASTALLDSGPI